MAGQRASPVAMDRAQVNSASTALWVAEPGMGRRANTRQLTRLLEIPMGQLPSPTFLVVQAVEPHRQAGVAPEVAQSPWKRMGTAP